MIINDTFLEKVLNCLIENFRNFMFKKRRSKMFIFSTHIGVQS